MEQNKIVEQVEEDMFAQIAVAINDSELVESYAGVLDMSFMT
ncbi:hypothetical protein V8G57_18165 [Collimonas sp. H4R21]|uniref:Uncharacterized protein n=1 Tax=Collimonas rhizosphaerae TaxID=3126357 RepID=A0ABU9PZH7_9BURK